MINQSFLRRAPRPVVNTAKFNFSGNTGNITNVTASTTTEGANAEFNFSGNSGNITNVDDNVEFSSKGGSSFSIGGNNYGVVGNAGNITSIGNNRIGSVGDNLVQGEGPVVEQDRKLEQKFDKVMVHGSINTMIDADEKTQGVRVQAQENIQDVVSTTIQDGVLHIKADGSYTTQGAAPTVLIDMDGISELTIHGSGDAKVKDLNSENLNTFVHGSGGVSVQGQTDNLNVFNFGSGSFDGRQLEAKTADVGIAGSGSADVNVTDDLRARVNGSGAISYAGGASVSPFVAGSGSIIART